MNTRPLQKVSNFGSRKQSSVSGCLQYLIPFKVGPLWHHTLSPAILPSLEGLFWNSVQLRHCFLYDVFVAVKTGAWWTCGMPCLTKKPWIRCDVWAGALSWCSCVRPTVPVSCAELHHEDDGGLLGSTPYWQFGLMVHTHDAQHPSNREEQSASPSHCSEPVMLFWVSEIVGTSDMAVLFQVPAFERSAVQPISVEHSSADLYWVVFG
jgi:hypothetical protein